MKNTYTILLLILSTTIFAQSEITQSNIPLVGDSVVIVICSDQLNPGEPGAMQTWDMSGLTATEEQYFTYIDPSEGLLADSFPDANLCARSWLDDYSYYKTSESSLLVEGYVVTIDPDETSTIVFNSSEQIIGLPYTYNSSFEDSFDGSIYLPGFSGLTFDGTLNFEADGYGTLILPTGTYQNVVRYHLYREQVNYINGIPMPTVQTKEQWAWVSSDYRFWLLLMEENFDGFNTSSLIWYDKNPYPATTGVPALQQATTAVSPNPVRTGQDLSITWNNEEPGELFLFSTDGRLIARQNRMLSEGINQYHLPAIDAGVYILKIETNKNSFTQKISVVD